MQLRMVEQDLWWQFLFSNNVTSTQEGPGCQEVDDIWWDAGERSFHCWRRSSYYLTLALSCRQSADKLWFNFTLPCGQSKNMIQTLQYSNRISPCTYHSCFGIWFVCTLTGLFNFCSRSINRRYNLNCAVIPDVLILHVLLIINMCVFIKTSNSTWSIMTCIFICLSPAAVVPFAGRWSVNTSVRDKTLSVRLTLTSLSRLSWIPSGFTVYVNAGCSTLVWADDDDIHRLYSTTNNCLLSHVLHKEWYCANQRAWNGF